MDLKIKLLIITYAGKIFEFFSPGIPIILKNAGCEFIIFDMEHGGLSFNEFKTLAIIAKLIKLTL